MPGRGTSVGGFHPVNVDIVVGKHGATNRRNADSVFLQSHLLDDFSYYLVHHSVAAARTIVHRVVVKQSRTGIYPVGRIYDLVQFHV